MKLKKNKINNNLYSISPKKIFFLILFINITFLLFSLSNAYTDGYNLRQAQTAIVAKNIFYDNFNIFPTRISFFAPQKGNLIFEFPFIHFLTALTYKVLPISEINGRFINLLFYIFNATLFYKIQKLIFQDKIAFITSSFFISSPLLFYLAHAYMPETSMMSFYLMAYYLFIKNKIKYNLKNEILMFIFLALAPLIKPPAGIIFFPIYLDYVWKKKLKFIIYKSIPFLISVLPFCLWMYYGKLINASELSTGTNWNWDAVLFGRGNIIQFWTSFNFYTKIIGNFLIQHFNPLIFLLSFYALIINFRSEDSLIKFHVNWIIGNLLFLFLLPGANISHPYYQIYFIPNILFFTSIGLLKIKDFFISKNFVFYSLIFINLILSISIFIYGSNQKIRISNLDEFKNIISEKVVIKKDTPSEYILYSHEGLASTSVYTYYSDSYSRQFKLESENISNLKEQINNGAKYIFFINTSYGNTIKKLKKDTEIFDWLNSNQIKLYESANMILYKLKRTT